MAPNQSRSLIRLLNKLLLQNQSATITYQTISFHFSHTGTNSKPSFTMSDFLILEIIFVIFSGLFLRPFKISSPDSEQFKSLFQILTKHFIYCCYYNLNFLRDYFQKPFRSLWVKVRKQFICKHYR